MLNNNCSALEGKLICAAATIGWSVCRGISADTKYVEFSRYSPAGEDFSFCLYYDEIEEIPDGVKEYYESFDVDDHVTMWLGAKKDGVFGVPSARELVDDAERIDEMLEELSVVLCGVYNNWHDN